MYFDFIAVKLVQIVWSLRKKEKSSYIEHWPATIIEWIIICTFCNHVGEEVAHICNSLQKIQVSRNFWFVLFHTERADQNRKVKKVYYQHIGQNRSNRGRSRNDELNCTNYKYIPFNPRFNQNYMILLPTIHSFLPQQYQESSRVERVVCAIKSSEVLYNSMPRWNVSQSTTNRVQVIKWIILKVNTTSVTNICWW